MLADAKTLLLHADLAAGAASGGVTFFGAWVTGTDSWGRQSNPMGHFWRWSGWLWWFWASHTTGAIHPQIHDS